MPAVCPTRIIDLGLTPFETVFFFPGDEEELSTKWHHDNGSH